MQVSGVTAGAIPGAVSAAAVSQQQASIEELTKLAAAVDSLDLAQAAQMVLRDPDPAKGAAVDTYA